MLGKIEGWKRRGRQRIRWLDGIRVFFNQAVLPIKWPKYWSSSFNISPSNEYSGLISFKIVLISLQCKGLSRVFSNTIVQSINSSVLSFLYSSSLTSIHDHWKNHNLDQTDLCWQNNVSAVEHAIQAGYNFPSKE